MGCGTSVEAEQVPPDQNATQNGVPAAAKPAAKYPRARKGSVEAELDAMEDDVTMVMDVEGWLQSLQLAEYWPAFETAGYDDLDTVMDMTEEDVLNDVKVEKGGHVKKLVKNIEKLKQNSKRQPSIPELGLGGAAATAASPITPAVRHRKGSVCVLSPPAPFLSVLAQQLCGHLTARPSAHPLSGCAQVARGTRCGVPEPWRRTCVAGTQGSRDRGHG